MKKIYFILFALSFIYNSFAQEDNRPGWIYNTPKAGNSSYLYVVEHAIGESPNEARNRALAQVYQSTMMRIGAVVSWDEVNNSLQNGDDWGKVAMKYNIPVNKVCEYIEKKKDGYLVFVLCQVAKSGSSYPDWDEFSGCSDVKTYGNGNALLKSAIIPGLGQLGKRRYMSGISTMLGEMALVGTGLVAYHFANEDLDYIKASSTNELSEVIDRKKSYNNWRIVNVSAYSAALALYVWNLYRAWSITPRYKKDKWSLSFYPVLMPTENDPTAGIGLTLKF